MDQGLDSRIFCLFCLFVLVFHRKLTTQSTVLSPGKNKCQESTEKGRASCRKIQYSDLASFKKRQGTLICISLICMNVICISFNHDDDDNTKATSKKSTDWLLWPRNLVSESNYFRAITIVRILLKITWKILPWNLKILGFLSQIFIKTMYRITKTTGRWRKTTGCTEKQQGTTPCCFGLARTYTAVVEY